MKREKMDLRRRMKETLAMALSLLMVFGVVGMPLRANAKYYEFGDLATGYYMPGDTFGAQSGPKMIKYSFYSDEETMVTLSSVGGKDVPSDYGTFTEGGVFTLPSESLKPKTVAGKTMPVIYNLSSTQTRTVQDPDFGYDLDGKICLFKQYNGFKASYAGTTTTDEYCYFYGSGEMYWTGGSAPEPGDGYLGWSPNKDYIDSDSDGVLYRTETEIVAEDVIGYVDVNTATLTLYPIKDVVDTSLEISMNSYTLEDDGTAPENAEPVITSNLPTDYFTVEYIRIINGTPAAVSDTLPITPGTYSLKVSTVGLSESQIREEDGAVTKRGHTAKSASMDFMVYGAGGAVTANTDLVYTGDPQALVSYDEENFAGLITFSDTKDGTYTTTVPTGTNAGTYTVWYKVGDEEPVKLEVTIDKGYSGIEREPIAVSNLKYTGTAQDLIVPGEATHGTMLYALGSPENYSESVPQATDRGNYTVYYMVKGDENYEDIDSPEELYVEVSIEEVASATVTAKDLTYNGELQQLFDITEETGGTVVFMDPTTRNDLTGIPTGKNAGEYVFLYRVDVGGGGENKFISSEPVEITATIKRAKPVVTAPVPKTLTYNGYYQALVDPGTTSVGKLLYNLENNGAGSDSVPRVEDAGTYKVWYFVSLSDLTAEESANYETDSADYVEVTVSPMQGKVEGVTAASGLEYNGEEQELLVLSGGAVITGIPDAKLVYSFEKNGTYSESVPTKKDAGTYTVYVKRLGVGDNVTESEIVSYTVSIDKKEVGLTWGTTAFTYDGESHLPTVTVTGVVGEEKCTAVVEGEETNAGTYTAKVTGLLVNGEEAINYVLPTAVTKSFTIGKKEVGLTWDKTEFTYDGTEHCPKATATGLVTGDTCNVTVETVDGPAVNAGDYEATATGLSNDNYTLPATATVEFEIKSTPTGIEKAPSAKEGLAYTGSDQELVNPGEATEGGKIQYSLEENGTYSDTIPAKKDAGTYKVYYKAVAADGNHVDADGDSQFVEVTIAKKTVGLDWSNLEFTYDGSEHCPETTVTGLVTGDTCTVTVTGGQTDAGTYEATATGLSNDNYELPATVTKSFEIKKASASITKVPTAVGGLVYDGTSHALVTAGTANGGKIQYSLTETGTYTDAVPVGKNAGTYTVYYKLVGLNANYAAENADGQFVEATITQKVVALDWQVTIGAYDGKERTVTATVAEEDLVVGDTCNVTVETIDGPAINAGNYTAKATALSNANYALPENVTQEFSIEKRDVFFSEKPVAKELTYTGAAQELVTKGKATEGGKIVYRLGDGEFSDTIPTGKAVGKYTVGVSVDATDNNHAGGSEYDEIEVTIAQKALTLTWSNTELTFNDKEQSPTATLNGVVGGDDVKVTVNEAKKEVGKYTATVTFSGTDIANYKLPTNTSVEFSIVKKEEPKKEKENGSATVTMGSFIYGGSATTPVVTSSTHDASKAAISYKASGAPDDAYSGTKPTGVGTYNVRAVLPENDKYKQCVAVGSFTISYLPVPEGAYEITGEKGNDGWFTSEVKLTPAAGYEISVGDRTSFRTGSVTLSEQMTGTTFYIRKTETGEQTAGVTIAAMQIDTDAPTIEMEENNVYFCDEEGKLLAVANDKNLDKVYVNGVEVPLTDDGNGTKTFDLPVDKKKQSVNVKVVDKAGNEKSMVVITAPAWMKSGVVGDGEYYLEPKNAYGTPKEGSCTLDGDDSTYMPGIKFYAKKEGFHTFHVNH